MAKKKSLSRETVLAMTLGPTATNVKLNASPQQWRKLVRTAHKKGLSMEEFFNRTPPALAAKTPGQLTSQATKVMNSAYAPAEAELNTRESQVNAISAKRQRDDEFYRQWLANQTAALQSDITSSNKLIADKLTGMDEAANAQYAQAAQAAAANVAAQPGVTQDVSRGNAIRQLPVDAAIAGVKRLGETTKEATGAQLSTGMVAATHANNLARFAADEASRTADTWKALSEIGGEKTKLKLSKAADVAKEVARLMDQEITKAQGNRDYSTLLQKLDIQAADVKVKGAKVKSDAKLKAQAQKDARQYHNALIQAKTDDRLYRQSRDDLDRKQKRDEFTAKYGKTPDQWNKMTDAERVAWMKKYSQSKSTKGGAGGKDGLTPNQKIKNIQTGNQFISSINTLVDLLKIKVDPKAGKVVITNRQKLLDQGYSAEMINAAYDIHEGRKIGSTNPLSAKSRAYVKRILRGYPGTKMPADW